MSGRFHRYRPAPPLTDFVDVFWYFEGSGSAHAKERLLPTGTIELADIALSCGYYDQAHFAHDFLAFSGINPTTYLRQRTAHMNHVPIPD